MGKFSSRQRLLPFLLFAAGAAVPGAWAQEQPVPPVEALKLLVRSNEVARGCNYLTDAERERLAQLAAAAEIATAHRVAAAEVRNALADARRAGHDAAQSCGEEQAQAVREVFAAADRAMTLAESGRAGRPRRTAATAPGARAQVSAQVLSAFRAGTPIERYGMQSYAYYVQRRCRHLSYAQAFAFWQNIANRHGALTGRLGAPAVASAQRAAEIRANGEACSARSAGLVLAGYEAAKRDAWQR